MAKIVLSVSLVNGSGFPDREISAHELLRAFVGDDLRPPAEGVCLSIYTDDGKRVNIGVPVKGGDPVQATVSDWNGTPPQAEPPSRTMCIAPLEDIVAILGPSNSFEETFGGTDKWECGCSAAPRLGYSRTDDDVLFEWIQCEEHTGFGPGPHSESPETF
jgi:hypothetical protein